MVELTRVKSTLCCRNGVGSGALLIALNSATALGTNAFVAAAATNDEDDDDDAVIIVFLRAPSFSLRNRQLTPSVPLPQLRQLRHCTMVQKRKLHRKNSNPIIHFPTSEGVSEVSERTSE